MARKLLLVLLVISLSAAVHAGSFFLRDDIEGFPPVSPDVKAEIEAAEAEEAPAETEEGPEVETTGENETEGTEGAEGAEGAEEGGEAPDLEKELEGFHCDPLESLLEELANATALDFYFDMLFDMGIRSSVEDKDEMFQMLADMTGYDLREHDGRHKLACALYGIKDIGGLAAFLALPVDMVEMMYELWQDGFKEMGGMETINVYSKVMFEFSTWCIETGYPEMPLKGDVNAEDIRDNMREWQTAILNVDMDRNTHLMDMVGDTVAPFKIMPEYTAMVLSTSQNTEDMRDKLCISDHAYLLYSHYASPANMQAMMDLMVIGVRIINEFSDMGLFALAS